MQLKPKFKLKRCSSCGKELPLWKSIPALCRPCYQKQNPPAPLSKCKIKPVSDKRRAQLQEYRRLRAQYLREHPVCQVRVQCSGQIATEIHHIEGRENELLNDTTKWKSICRACHDEITENSAQAIQDGHSISRLNIKAQ